MTLEFLIDRPPAARATLLLTHGAGAPMDSANMTAATAVLSGAGLVVARFEFGYMAARRTESGRRPPPRAERLNPEFHAAVDALDAGAPLIIGGMSMGGRVASMIADELFAAGRIAGLLCLGYPFHPPAKPHALRTAHLQGLQTPALIVQGTRDLLGNYDEVSGYELSSAIEILWLEDGDHSLKPRKRISGFTAADHLNTMAKNVVSWIDRITPAR